MREGWGGGNGGGEGGERTEPIPLSLRLVMYAELIFYGYGFLRSYFTSFQEKWHVLGKDEVGQTHLWAAEMRKGVLCFVCAYLVADMLCENALRENKVELLLLVHVLQMGVYIGTLPPCPMPIPTLALNQHLWLTVGLWVTGWSYARKWCQYVLMAVLLFALYMNAFLYRSAFGWKFTYSRYHMMIVEVLRLGRTYVIRAAPTGCYLCVTGPDRPVEVMSLSQHKQAETAFVLRNQGGHLYHVGSDALGGCWLRLDAERRLSVASGMECACLFELEHRGHGYRMKAKSADGDLWLRIDREGRSGISGGLVASEDPETAGNFVFEHEDRSAFQQISLPQLGWDRDRMAINILDWLGFSNAPLSPVEEREQARCCRHIGSLLFIIFTVVLVSAAVRISLTVQDDDLGEMGQCTEDTGGRCSVLEHVVPGLSSCATWRNSRCNRGDKIRGSCVCDLPRTCAYRGVCLPNPNMDKFGDGLAAPPRKQRALVLSGGGAKGAWEVGVLEEICENSRLARHRNWTMLVGTSIGAINSAFLAQFAPERQCSEGVPALGRYWGSIVTSEDIWQSPNPWNLAGYNHHKCFSLLEGAAMIINFGTHGGICNALPGAERFEFGVNATRIRTSGMKLRVLATSLRTGSGNWWTESSKEIVSGAEASGSIAPLVQPKQVDGEWFIDGGLRHNTPLLKALQEGAPEVLVMIMNPLTGPQGVNVTKLEASQDMSVGWAISEFEINLLMYRYFVDGELEFACANYAQAKIWGYVPRTEVGTLVSFDHGDIEEMRRRGRETAKRGPVELCDMLAKQKKSRNDEPVAQALAEEPVVVQVPPSVTQCVLLPVAAAVFAYVVGASQPLREGPQCCARRGVAAASAAAPLLDHQADASHA